ncbi:glycosyltransferase family 4 protein [Microbacterium jejuense]|uniref:Glycosyltransferase family 4 protein n=1 Tax=Microbacterium jejuense TaxID=1263637 RepID=A0ABS7HPH1_9MICO|nr:glycosyltransferase family 1 protein [Microbacterium jejuense]MBW9094610.1 glycosyltransferase family 4 protein [Microbacterium jejuense]
MPRVLVDLLSFTGTKGGMETYTRELYAAIGRAPAGYEFVGFVSREGAALDTSWFPGRIVESGISGENRFEWAWGELTQVSRAASRERVDLIHAPATLGPRRASVPTVLTIHDVLYFSHPEHMSTPLYTEPVKWMEKQASRNAARIVTISPTSASEITKYLHVPGERIDVVPLAGSAPKGVERARAGEEGPLILAMGNRRPHKNWAALIRATALIPEDKRARIVITGGRGEDPLTPIVDEYGVADWVDLRGWVNDEEVARLYSVATALAIPSFAEGFSLPTIEAMAAGIPTLLSDIDVHRYVGGDAAHYFDPTDDADVARAITDVVTNAALRAQMVRAGYAQAAGFSWDRTASETLSVFDKVLGRH